MVCGVTARACFLSLSQPVITGTAACQECNKWSLFPDVFEALVILIVCLRVCVTDGVSVCAPGHTFVRTGSIMSVHSGSQLLWFFSFVCPQFNWCDDVSH